MTPQEKMKALLEKIGLPFIKVETYGNQITVDCKGKDTADKWASVLAKFAKIRGLIETNPENKANRGTCLLPTRHKAYRVYACLY